MAPRVRGRDAKMVVVAIPTVIRDFDKQVKNQPEIDPDVVTTLVEFKDSYFADPDPAHWTVEILEELLLGILPRKVTAPDEWFAAVTPTTRAYLQFLIDSGRMTPGGDPAAALLATVDRIGDGVLMASRDPRNFGMTKAILTRMGFDPSRPDSARAAMEGFNDLPDAERAAVIDPALRGLGIGDDLDLPDIEEIQNIDARRLPAIWLPPAAELAAAVHAAPLVTELLRLVAWNEPGRKVTRREVLPLPDARRACTDLGLPLPPDKLRTAEHIPALHRLWSLALDCDLLQITRGRARRGEAADLLADSDADPDDVVAWWVYLLDTCLGEGLDLGENDEDDDDEDDEDDEDEDDAFDAFEDDVMEVVEDETFDADEDDVVEAVEDTLLPALRDLYSAGRVPLEDLDRSVEETVHEILHSLFAATDLPDDQVRVLARRRWRAHVDQLVDLGAAAIDDGGLDLTPLGRAGIRSITLEDGGQAPLIDDPATLDTPTLLRDLPPLGESVATPLLNAWSATRPPTQAIDQILDAARAGTASTRMSALSVLKTLYAEHLHAAAHPRLQALRDDPILAALVHVLLTESGQPVHLPPHLQQWTALEAVALFVESEAFDEESPTFSPDALTFLWQIVDQDADLDTAATNPHPQLDDVLNAIATHHPQGRTRKAAKKALFKARSQRPGHQPEQGKGQAPGRAPRGGRRR